MFDINTHSIMLGFLLSRMWFVKIHGIDISIGNYEQKTKKISRLKNNSNEGKKEKRKGIGGNSEIPFAPRS